MTTITETLPLLHKIDHDGSTSDIAYAMAAIVPDHASPSHRWCLPPPPRRRECHTAPPVVLLILAKDWCAAGAAADVTVMHSACITTPLTQWFWCIENKIARIGNDLLHRCKGLGRLHSRVYPRAERWELFSAGDWLIWTKTTSCSWFIANKPRFILLYCNE